MQTKEYKTPSPKQPGCPDNVTTRSDQATGPEPAKQGLFIRKRIKKDGALLTLAPSTWLATQVTASLKVGSLVLLFNIRDPPSGAVPTEKIDRGVVAMCCYAAETKAWHYTVFKCPGFRAGKATLTNELCDGGR